MVQGKCPVSFCSFWWGCLLEHSLLDGFCLDQFSAIQGKFYIQRFSNTSFAQTLLSSVFGGLLLEQTLFGTLQPRSHCHRVIYCCKEVGRSCFRGFWQATWQDCEPWSPQSNVQATWLCVTSLCPSEIVLRALLPGEKSAAEKIKSAGTFHQGPWMIQVGPRQSHEDSVLFCIWQHIKTAFDGTWCGIRWQIFSVLSVLHCVEWAFDVASRGTPKLKTGHRRWIKKTALLRYRTIFHHISVRLQGQALPCLGRENLRPKLSITRLGSVLTAKYRKHGPNPLNVRGVN